MAKFVPRVRKHKVKARQAESAKPQSSVTPDSNVIEILPSDQDARRAQLTAELRAQQPQDHISSKKRKRLDHYIDTKLRKEENLDLIKKIAAQNHVDTSLFRSAKNLGRVKDTQREVLKRAIEEREQGINVEQNEAILFDARANADDVALDSEHVPGPIIVPESASAGLSSQTTPSVIGSGLKRPLEQGEDGRPVVTRRKRRRREAPMPKPVPALSYSDNDDDNDDYDDDDDDENDGEDDDDDEDKAGNGLHDRETNSDLATSEDEWNGFSEDDIHKKQPRSALKGSRAAHGEDLNQPSSEFATDSEGSSTDDFTDESEDEDDGSEENISESDSQSDTTIEATKARSSAFKAWAIQQRNASLGFTPSSETVPSSLQSSIQPSKPHVKPTSSLPAVPKLEVSTVKTSSIVIPRSDEIQEARLKLPVVQEEQKIMEAINVNTTTVVWGATGSGKTTQIPQMLYESGYGSNIGKRSINTVDRTRGMIGVTQPRRVAATSVAARVATEMGTMSSRVGHQVRFDTTVSSRTAIKFMTDGILLREVATDFILSRYSVVVIDEAHERSVNTDVLIGLLSRIVNLRATLAREQPERHYPLKLVIMSATLRLEDFTQNKELFQDGPPPVVRAEGRQYTVVEHFSKRTRVDYVDEMFKKVSRGHRQLPPGGMLVFMTGKDEIVALSKKLQQAAMSAGTGYMPVDESKPFTMVNGEAEDDNDNTDGVAVRMNIEEGEDDEDALGDDGSDDHDEKQEFVIEGDEATDMLKMHILPLHSQLPAAQQMRVFQPPPEDSRLIILATNVAETSLTIPGIRYVFDCGRVKSKDYDPVSGVQSFKIDYISKASAAQRAGRAGRTGPGHCYRLYSSAVYERDFEQNAEPDILRLPVENVALLIKSVDFPNVANFPFPTPPDRRALAKAESLLRYLGAVDLQGKITDAGRALASYPLSPRFARMLLLAQTQGLLAHAMAVVSALAVPELLLPPPHLNQQVTEAHDEDSDEDVKKARPDYEQNAQVAEQVGAYGRAQGMLSRWDDRADVLKLLTAFALCSSASAPSKADKLAARCEQYFVRERAMKEAFELRSQLVRIAETQMPDGTVLQDISSLPILEADDRAKLKYIVASGYIDQIAVRLDHLRASNPSSTVSTRKPRRAIEVAYRTLFPTGTEDASLPVEEREASLNSYVHASSLLARLSVAEMPTYIVYSHLSRAAIKTIEAGPARQRTRIHPLCTVSARQLVALTDGTPLLEVGKPIGKIEAMARGTDGRERRGVWVGLSLRGQGESWPVGNRKEIQVRRDGTWTTEKVVG